jgi:hypothetical protein
MLGIGGALLVIDVALWVRAVRRAAREKQNPRSVAWRAP